MRTAPLWRPTVINCRWHCNLWCFAIAAAVCSGSSLPAAQAADLEESLKLYRTGEYEKCARQAGEAIDAGVQGEQWPSLKIQADLARGEYKAALATLDAAMARYPGSLPLVLLARDVFRHNGEPERETPARLSFERYLRIGPQRYASPENQVDLGRFFLRRRADAKKVLDQFYDPVIAQRPGFVEAFLASAELALEKQDFGLASDTLAKAPKAAALDPRFHYLTALAFAEDDRAQSAKALAQALKINSRHADSLLLKADGLIDAEQYADAAKVLAEILAVNPREPRAWAYKAVLAHLANRSDDESAARKSALATWAGNPEVDSLIGRKLAQKYRFAEGAECQRRALTFDNAYLPAKIQLCQALLRLGQEAEGWKLADEIFDTDGYNVVAYNLVTLHDQLVKFRELKDGGISVRMDPLEADLYGTRVLALLLKAKTTLCEKYGITLADPVIVEIFPRKREFAVRTFGLPGADGLLGVCFGSVITANSPASGGEHPSNWEAVLWHELCHAVTLAKSKNKMPRWMSEGISVYEEEQQDPSWEGVLPQPFRAMIAKGELTPLSKLSSAFLAPRSPAHLQFAYRESALAVEFLVGKAGIGALKSVLDDLGAGATLDEALPRRFQMTLTQLDDEFSKFAKQKVAAIVPQTTWEECELPPTADSATIAGWLTQHPKSFRGQQRLAQKLLTEEKWTEAKQALLVLKDLDPNYIGSENAYVLLASIYKHESDKTAEHAVLEDLATRSANAMPAFLRLMELDEAAKDWDGLAKNSRRLLAVNPLIPAPHRGLALALENLEERDAAITSYRALARIDNSDAASVHYRLARLLRDTGKRDEARREVLKSLEEAPRFLDSHRLLLELTEPEKAAGASPPADPSPKEYRR
jgi:tetratricopeptide (TPR) repeat protein